jgi:pimeloyl-ACP methyl ester carboxylesterase
VNPTTPARAARLIPSLLVCLLGGVAAPAAGTAQHRTPTAPSTLVADPTRHRSAFVVHRGVRLHYLDWGGREPAVVLLPGYGLTAHAYDEIGALLADGFRVIAATPRGYGESDAPPDAAGYTVATMVADLRALLDTLGVREVALVGHSISGATIAAFARAHPDRVTRLVFLDAFPYYAAAGGDSVEALNPVSAPGFSGAMTYARVRDFLGRYRFGGWSPALEADLRANALGPELMRRQALTGGYVADSRAHPPDLTALAVPALQACAVPTVATEYPWLQPGTRLHARATTYVRDVLRPFNRRLCTRFAELVPRGRTVEVAGSHYVFFTQPAAAARLIRRFLSE